MADITVDRLLVLIEAQTRTFEAQLRKLEGQVAGSSRRMSTAFAAFNTQIRQVGSSLGRAFGFGGVGRGPLAAVVALGYAINKTANSFGDLRKQAMDAGVAIDENLVSTAEKFNAEWDRAWLDMKIKGTAALAAIFGGDFKKGMAILDSMLDKSAKGPVGNQTQISNISAKGGLETGGITTSFARLNELLEESQHHLDDIKDAANGVNDAFRDFTFSTIDDFNNVGDAAINLGKTIEKNLIDALLFGGGPFAGLMGTSTANQQFGAGAPGGLIGGAIQSLFGRTFGGTGGGLTGQPAYNYIGATSGEGAMGGVLGSATGKIAGQLFGGDALPAGVTSGPTVTSGPNSASNQYAALIAEASAKYNLDPKLLTAMIQQESNFDPNAVSSTGAMGLTQLMPKTALSLGVYDPFNPQENIDAGARYLSQQTSRFGTAGGLAAYNMGPTAYANSLASGSALPAETQSYLAKILGFLGIPMMAGGGVLGAGQSAIVGEGGLPELITPRAPSNVIPLNGGMGGVTVYSYGAQVDTQRRNDGSLEIVINKHLKRTLRDTYGIKPKVNGRT